MLKNYFKIAIAVLRRRKFFTFISLFGISFTLSILIVLTAFIDHFTSDSYPETNRDNSLYVQSVQQKSPKGFTMRGPVSMYFVKEFIEPMKSVEKVGVSSIFSPTNTYIKDRKLVLDLKFTNDAFWDVIGFQFVEGKPYSGKQIEQAEKVAVITESARHAYFGSADAVVGKYIETDNVKYRISGVVKDVPLTMLASYADVYVPYTVSKRDLSKREYNGNFIAVLQIKNGVDLKTMQDEYASVVSKIPPIDPEFSQITSSADSYLAGFTRELFGNSSSSGVGMFAVVIGIFVLFFMLLPTLNLVNINISRIMERSSEIGVRKAFGASSRTLVYQFLVENIILTFAGTVLGIALAIGVMAYFNSSGVIPHLHLSLNFQVVLAALVLCLVFGFVSGVYPAWRMSRMQVVDALKEK